jgi:alcohol dehydrogenase class IV
VTQELLKTKADCVIAVGGGSVLDVAKTAAALCTQDVTDVRPYHEKELTLSKPGLPLIALPTTSGTGAEITKNAVLTNTQANCKRSIRSEFIIPHCAIVDPALTLSLPRTQTIQSGMDALTQAIESYLSRNATSHSMALASKAVSRLLPHLEPVANDLANLPGREALAEGSMLCAMAFSQSSLGAVHGLAHPLGHLLAIPHGYCCAVLLPVVLRHNLDSEIGKVRLNALAHEQGFTTGEAFVAHIQDMCDTLKIPRSFKQDGLCSDHFHYVLANCRSGSMKSNPKHLEDEEVLQLLQGLCG